MKIIKATYGGVDVSSKLISKIHNDHIFILVSNNLFGDTNVGVVKYLETEIEIDGLIFSSKVRENDFFIFPKSKNNRLGIFYSNNDENSARSCIVASLKQINIASKHKADIITNLWNSESDNPFFETIAWTKTSSHLNQILQILQCLYTAKKINNYKYVSFLEHDVLYPEGYFDYPDFDEDIICNMNYIGLNKQGFQKRNQNDKPLSQLSMNFEFAIKHFLNLIPNAIVLNSGLVEPQSVIKEWNCVNPAVHVNHGKHFTSHYNIYSKKDIELFNSYWGESSKYMELLYA